MTDIGQTLREARVRRRIDMSEVEAATKIRAKYLRALENEEWELLPGSTFVKTFLRTYAEYLELDARMLVEEYRQRYERPSTQDLTPFAAGLGRKGRLRRRRLAALGPWAVVAVGIVALLGILYWLGTSGPEDDEMPDPSRVESPARSGDRRDGDGRGDRREERERPEPRPRRVRVRLIASGDVYVCLVDARGRQVIDEEILTVGTRTRVFTSRSFRSNFGNGNLRMQVNGRSYPVAQSSEPVGYELRPGRRPRQLASDARPDCSS
jgi:cytoskeleton protein RodZ